MRAGGDFSDPFADVDDLEPPLDDDDTPWPSDADDGRDGAPVLPPEPLALARHVRATMGGHVHHLHGDFLAWDDGAYSVLDDAAISARAYAILESVRVADGDASKRYVPSRRRVADVIDALRADCHLDPRPLPFWCPETEGEAFDPQRTLVTRREIVDLATDDRRPATPRLITLSTLPYDLPRTSTEPTEWLHFMESLWADDAPSIRTLQLWTGLCLVPDTSHQKALLLVGPKRSGKGTIARIMREILGAENVAGPTMSDLASEFGLSALIDKLLAVVPDARVGYRTDGARVVERILSITGEDALVINRKNRPLFTTTLPTRLILISNVLPALLDPSGTLASRFVVLRTEESWFGKEDRGLLGRLRAEAPQILAWAVEGWRALNNGEILGTPPTAAQAVEDLERATSPVLSFITDECVVEPGAEVGRDGLWARWKAWSEENGRKHGTREALALALKSAVPGLVSTRRQVEGVRQRGYAGIRLRDGGKG
jgi:putative DNA primase/helicase